MNEPLISVVIPTYNSGKFINRTLDCLKEQTFKAFEVIIINDGSNDDTKWVISSYISSAPDLTMRLINQENKGIAGARNRGILEARCNYIAFLDHDDIWYSQKLSECYAVISSHPDLALVCHNEILRDVSGRIIRRQQYGPYVPEMFRKLLYRGNCLSTSATVVRREILLKEGLFRESTEFSTAEDYDLWLRLSKKYKFYFIQDILGEYIFSERNASSNLEKHYNNQINVLSLNFKEFTKKNISDFVMIKTRIATIHLIIAKSFIIKKRVKKAFHYFLKACF